MNWPMLIGAAVVCWIGSALLDDAKNGLGKSFGIFLILLSGALIWNSFEEESARFDHDRCAQYVYVQQGWKCVPWEEGG